MKSVQKGKANDEKDTKNTKEQLDMEVSIDKKKSDISEPTLITKGKDKRKNRLKDISDVLPKITLQEKSQNNLENQEIEKPIEKPIEKRIKSIRLQEKKLINKTDKDSSEIEDEDDTIDISTTNKRLNTKRNNIIKKVDSMMDESEKPNKSGSKNKNNNKSKKSQQIKETSADECLARNEDTSNSMLDCNNLPTKSILNSKSSKSKSNIKDKVETEADLNSKQNPHQAKSRSRSNSQNKLKLNEESDKTTKQTK
eukprot:CAMPEP_0116986492 /NCGR_PEP_ID=MMETSP0467-20121206/62910_1 /TAXON_ID=283647 /ORGANISM="Mesodinium pulex, Strain SPMC105" /LENGTH=253 /DNA_ID=CAMNT_0004682065 /DNA_START=504 /DNA_END=1262 /DNA_ORIENTATION=+